MKYREIINLSLSKLKDKLYNLFKDTIYSALKLLFIFPINKKRIIFYSFGGTKYSCNPKYVSAYIARHYPNRFQLIWAVRDIDNPLLKKTPYKIVKYNSLAFIYYRITSAVIITNDGLPTYIPSRKKQLNINTWHGGGCYKKTTDPNNHIIRRKKTQTTHFLSSCELFSENELKKEFHFSGVILPIGLPRNDIFFNNQNEDIVGKVKEGFHIPPKTPVILYAPTWRAENTEKIYLPDFGLIKSKYKEVFHQEPVIMVRAHHAITTKIQEGDWINATDYPDVQELLVAATILITDYSSIVWDFSFTGKPCLLFTPDLDEYKKTQGFHIAIEEWGFPICKDSEELANAIIHFDPDVYAKNMQRHHEMFGSYEHGNACEKLANYIIDSITQ